MKYASATFCLFALGIAGSFAACHPKDPDGCGFAAANLEVVVPEGAGSIGIPGVQVPSLRRRLQSGQATGRTLVTFRKGVSEAKARKLLGSSLKRYWPRFGIALLEGAPPAAIESSGDILSHETEGRVRISDEQGALADCTALNVSSKQRHPWGIDAIRADKAWSITRGHGAKVAIIDTGIRATHADLSGQVKGGVSFVGDDPTKWDDDHSHGTHVAGTVAAVDNSRGVVGVAPEAELYAVKVLGSDGTGADSQVIDGLDWAVENGMDVANLSLGRPGGPTTAFERAMREAVEAGVVVVVAAGNDGDEENEPQYPASSSYAVSVAAVDEKMKRADFSNTVSNAALSGPGQHVLSSVPDGYQCKSGTSMATPHVAGVFALMKSVFPGLPVSSCRAKAECTARDLGAPGRDDEYGHGLIDAFAALSSSGSCGAAPVDPELKISAFHADWVTVGTSGILVSLQVLDRSDAPASGAKFTLVAAAPGDAQGIGFVELTTGVDGTAQAFLSGLKCGSILFSLTELGAPAGGVHEFTFKVSSQAGQSK